MRTFYAAKSKGFQNFRTNPNQIQIQVQRCQNRFVSNLNVKKTNPNSNKSLRNKSKSTDNKPQRIGFVASLELTIKFQVPWKPLWLFWNCSDNLKISIYQFLSTSVLLSWWNPDYKTKKLVEIEADLQTSDYHYQTELTCFECKHFCEKMKWPLILLFRNH